MPAGAYVPSTPTGVQFVNASSTSDGMMSAADKAKLDLISSGATIIANANGQLVIQAN